MVELRKESMAVSQLVQIKRKKSSGREPRMKNIESKKREKNEAKW